MNNDLYLKTFTPKTKITMTNQRTHRKEPFRRNEVQLQIEGVRETAVSVRGKYPNDAWWATVNLDELEET